MTGEVWRPIGSAVLLALIPCAAYLTFIRRGPGRVEADSLGCASDVEDGRNREGIVQHLNHGGHVGLDVTIHPDEETRRRDIRIEDRIAGIDRKLLVVVEQIAITRAEIREVRRATIQIANTEVAQMKEMDDLLIEVTEMGDRVESGIALIRGLRERLDGLTEIGDPEVLKAKLREFTASLDAKERAFAEAIIANTPDPPPVPVSDPVVEESAVTDNHGGGGPIENLET